MDVCMADEDGNHASIGAGWELHKSLKVLLADIKNGDADKIPEAQKALRDYARLGLRGPANLHSCMVRHGMKLARAGGFPTFSRFLKWWNLDTFQPDDYVVFYGTDLKDHGCLAELVFAEAAHQAIRNGNLDEKKFVLAQMEGHGGQPVVCFDEKSLESPASSGGWIAHERQNSDQPLMERYRFRKAYAELAMAMGEGAGNKDIITAYQAERGLKEHIAQGWELHKWLKQVLSDMAEGNTVNVSKIKRTLKEYLRLGLHGPNLLHSCMVRHGTKFAKLGNFPDFNMFFQEWDPSTFRPEDYEPYVDPQGKTHPSLVETVLLRSAKQALSQQERQSRGELDFVLRVLEQHGQHFPENIWLLWNRIKVLQALERQDEALSFALEFLREKPQEFWAWGLLGDLVAVSDEALALSCYAKALTCNAEDNFTVKVRISFARCLAGTDPLRASRESQHVLRMRERTGQKIPEELRQLLQEDWYQAAPLEPNETAYYSAMCCAAEDFIFRDMPSLKGILGPPFSVVDKKSQKSRKWRSVYYRDNGRCMSSRIPFKAFQTQGLPDGAAVRVWLKRSNVGVHSGKSARVCHLKICDDGDVVDCLDKAEAVVTGYDHERKCSYLVTEKRETTILPVALGRFEPGTLIEIRYASAETGKGKKISVFSACKMKDISSHDCLLQSFSGTLKVFDAGFGLVQNDSSCRKDELIFIPPDLVKSGEFHESNGHAHVSGKAVLNFNKKRNEWGWKAITVK